MNLFNLPALLDCVQSARAAFRAALPGANAWLWPNNVGPSAKVIGGAQWSVYQRLDWVGRQSFALYAEGKYLDDIGAEFNLPRKLATACSGNVVVTVTGAASVSATATFSRADGTIYTATAAASATAAGNVTVPVIGPAGLLYNTAELSPMTILSGVTGAGASGATAAVDSNGLAGGQDIEPDGAFRSSDLATYRGRILFRKRNPPQGGAPADYVTWCGEISGVTRTFVERCWAGPGTVRVFPIFDTLFAGGIANSANITLVNDALALDVPAACEATIVAPTAQPINVAIVNLTPATAAAQAAVTAELTDAFTMYGKVSGSDTAVASMPYLAAPFTFLAIWIEQAVANAAGVTGADVTATDTVIASGCIPTLGTVTFS